MYQRCKRTEGKIPSIAEVARKCKKGETFVSGVLVEFFTEQNLLPKDTTSRKTGPGSRALRPEHFSYLLKLRSRRSTRLNSNYCKRLYQKFGLRVSESLISDVFLRGFPHSARMNKANLIPAQKYSPQNASRYAEACLLLSMIPPNKIKFADEKTIKGDETYDSKSRRDPIDGTKEPAKADSSDVRQSINVIAIMSANKRHLPLYYSAGEFNGTSYSFKALLIRAIVDGFFEPWDFLVIDNCQIHSGSDCSDIVEFMWNAIGPDGRPLRVFVLFLPTYSPELNSIELVFRTIPQRMKALRRRKPRRFKRRGQMWAAEKVLDGMSHRLMKSLMIQAGYINGW